MKQDYKQLLKEKKATATRIMSSNQLQSCNYWIHGASVAALAAGALPIPVVDNIPISAAQIGMVVGLGKVFGVKLTESVAKGLISAITGTFIGRNLVRLIPIVGWAISGSVAAAVTEAVGWAVAVDLAKDAKARALSKDIKNEMTPDLSVAFVGETIKSKQIEIINGLKARVDPFLKGEKNRKENADEYNKLRKDFEYVFDELSVDDPLRDDYDRLCDL